jgi:hypothetical protein
MIQTIKTIFDLGPLLFAFGFITPLIAQVIDRAGWDVPFGLSPLAFGLILAAILGGISQVRGRWI